MIVYLYLQQDNQMFPPEIQTSIYLCSFELEAKQANILIKFPSTYFLQWRTINGYQTVESNRYKPSGSVVIFGEKMKLETEMIYDNRKLQFVKKETLVMLNLLSRSRPDQVKLVGRVNVDLAKVINVDMYAQPTQFKLNFCSVEGSVVMQFRALSQQLTNLSIHDLDRSSFIDYFSPANNIKSSQISLPRQSLTKSIHKYSPKNSAIKENNESNFFISKDIKKTESRTENILLKDSNLKVSGHYLEREKDQLIKTTKIGSFEEKSQSIEKKKLGVTMDDEEEARQKEKKRDDANHNLVISKSQSELKQKEKVSKLEVKVKIQKQNYLDEDKLLEWKPLPKNSSVNSINKNSIDEQLGAGIIEELESYKKQLKQMTQIKSQNMALNEKINQLNVLVRQGEKQIELQKRYLAQAIFDCQRVGKEKNQLSQKLIISQRVRVEIQELKRQRDSLNTHFQEEKKERQYAESRLMQTRAELQDIKRSLLDCQKQLRSKQKQWASKLIEWKQLQQKLRCFEEKKVQKQQFTINIMHKADEDELKDEFQTKINQIISTYEFSKEKLNRQLEQLKAERQTKQILVLELRGQIQQGRSTINLLQNEITKWKLFVQNQQNSPKQATDQNELNKEIREQLQILRNKYDQAVFDGEKLKLSLRQHQKMTKDLKKDYQDTSKLLQKTIAQSSRWERESRETKSRVNEMEEDLRAKQGKISHLNSLLQQQIDRCQQLSSTIMRYEEKEWKMRETLDVLEEESKEIIMFVQEREEREGRSQKNEREKEKAIELLKRQNQKLTREVTTAKEHVIEVENIFGLKISELQEQLALQREKLMNDFILNENLRKSLQESSNTHQRLQRENKELLMKQEASIAEWKRRVEYLENQVGEKQRINQQLLVKLREINIDESKIQLSKLSLLNSTLEKQLNDKSLKCQQLERIIKDLERSVKLKNIELDTVKHKNIPNTRNILDSEIYEEEANSNLVLKERDDQTIDIQRSYKELQAEWNQKKDKWAREKQKLENKIESLQEQKFSLESDNNERDILIIDLKGENNRLTGEIAFLQEKITQIEGKSEWDIRRRLQQELEAYRAREQEYMVNILDLQLKLNNLDGRTDKTQGLRRSFANQEGQQNFLDVICTRLKHILQERTIQLPQINQQIWDDEGIASVGLHEKARMLSRQFHKLKAQMLKGEGRSQQERMRWVSWVKPCEGLVSEIVSLVESISLSVSSF